MIHDFILNNVGPIINILLGAAVAGIVLYAREIYKEEEDEKRNSSN